MVSALDDLLPERSGACLKMAIGRPRSGDTIRVLQVVAVKNDPGQLSDQFLFVLDPRLLSLMNLGIWYLGIGDHVCLSDRITVRLFQKSKGSAFGVTSGDAIPLCRGSTSALGLPPLDPFAVLVSPFETA